MSFMSSYNLRKLCNVCIKCYACSVRCVCDVCTGYNVFILRNVWYVCEECNLFNECNLCILLLLKNLIIYKLEFCKYYAVLDWNLESKSESKFKFRIFVTNVMYLMYVMYVMYVMYAMYVNNGMYQMYVFE